MADTRPATSIQNHARNVSEQKIDASLRNWARHIRLWHVCDNAACRAAHACRGDVPSCWRSNFPRLPDLVQLWTFAMMSTKEYGMTAEEMLAELDRTELTPAFVDWLEETDAANAAPSQQA